MLINTDVEGFQALRPRIEPGHGVNPEGNSDAPKVARRTRWIKHLSADVREYSPGTVPARDLLADQS